MRKSHLITSETASGDATMKNIYDVLRKKESDLEQLQREIEALRIAARLLAEEADAATSNGAPSTTARPAAAAQWGIKHFP